MLVPYVTFDVFTQVTFGGNPLAVVLDGVGLDTATMQAIAREFGYSETTFVLPPEDPAHTARVRIFTPLAEIPFAGHPTVGTAIALAQIDSDLVSPPNAERPLVLEEGVGPVPVVVRASIAGQKADFARFTAARLPESGRLPADASILAAAASLDPEDIREPVAAYGAGLAFAIAPVASLDRIRAAVPNQDVFRTWLAGSWAEALLLVTEETETQAADLHVRMFAPTLGLPEDPATGSAAVALAGWLAEVRRPADGHHVVRIEQGSEMGRPSHLFLDFDIAGGSLTRVRLAGHAVKVTEGMLHLPDRT